MHDASPEELRVLGCLIEKQHATPDQYPLSLNALRLACNQATNRDPVVAYDEQTIREALERLKLRGWARLASGPGSRAVKHRHLLDEALGLGRAELALLAVMMLRGPQTLNELRARTERLHPFASADEIVETLAGLVERELVVHLGRRPGQREDRYGHLLGGEAPAEEAFDARAAVEGLDGLVERERLWELLADDVEWLVAGSLPFSGAFRGEEAVRRWLRDRDGLLEHDRVEPVEVLGAGDAVVEIVRASGRARATGRPFDGEVVRVWTFRGRYAVRVRTWLDTAAYERALG